MEPIIRNPEPCFVICPIDDEDSPTRMNSDLLFEKIIWPVTKELNYSPIRGDRVDEAGTITLQIIDLLVESPLVIADLTGHNASVFYELAVRHTIQKPCILMMKYGEKIPIYVKPARIIFYDLENPTKVEEAKKSLINQIKNMDNAKYCNDNPIAQSQKEKMLAKTLLKNGNEEYDALTLILGELVELSSAVTNMKREVSSLHGKLRYLDDLGIPFPIEAEGLSLEMMYDNKISDLNSQSKDLRELIKYKDDPLLKKNIEEIDRQIRVWTNQKKLYKDKKTGYKYPY